MYRGHSVFAFQPVVKDAPECVETLLFFDAEAAFCRSCEFSAAFERVVGDGDNAIIAVTEKLAAACGDVIAEYTKKNASPLVTVIPDRHTGEKEASKR